MRDQIKKKFLFIVNPEASRCDLTSLESVIRKYFKKEEFFYEILVISNRESVETAVNSVIQRKFDVIIAAGGDGTIAGVANHLISNKDIDFGVIPIGTSNALAKELNIPTDIDAACELIAGNYGYRCIDAMKMNDQYYYNRISVGLSSVAIEETSDEVKKSFGTVGYLVSSVGTVMNFEAKNFKVIINGKEQTIKARDVVVNNCNTVLFSNVTLGEKVSPSDGNLEVIIFESKTFTEYLKSIKDVVVGEDPSGENIQYIENVKSIIIEPDEKLPVQADGDLAGESPIKIEIIPEALQLIVPNNI
jgi:diacylglycerol kinase (ATP)